MCKTFDTLYDRYLSGVKSGALADNAMNQLDPMSEAHRQHSYDRDAAYTRVKTARVLMEAHRRECGECRLALSARTVSRARVDEVDPAEFSEPPLLAMMEAR